MLNVRQVEQPECATGDTASPTTVAWAGDSNAAMWAAGVEQVATRRHWRLETLTKSGCPSPNLPTKITIASGREYRQLRRRPHRHERPGDRH
jgi:SGNH domain (fused to AT3 domains)